MNSPATTGAGLHARISELKAEWDHVQPLSVENEQRLWRKLRLEWNYNSNHIEGNTLTYGETELLIIQGKTTGQHELREYEEMKAHDVAIQYIRDLAGEDRPITEGDIRDLNQVILKEPFWKEARTADGQASRKLITPGAYKTTPNNVQTATGEMFMFKSPEATPSEMADLTLWFREKLEDASLDLPLLLATFHHRFSVIHPFDDGNGRTMRLLVNYALLKKGYLPIIIKSENKKEYLGVLGAADAGDIKPFAQFIAWRMIEILGVGLKAAGGESIEDPEDWQKEMTLLVRDYGMEGSPAPSRSPELIMELIDQAYPKLVDSVWKKSAPLTKIFSSCTTEFEGESARILRVLKKAWSERDSIINNQIGASGTLASFIFTLQGFSSPNIPAFDVGVSIQLNWQKYRYSITSNAFSEPIQGLRYDRPLSDELIDKISSDLGKYLFNKVKTQLNSKELQ